MIGNRQRSGHHQRQFSSDNFLIDPSASSKLAQNTSHQVEYSRMMRSMQKGMGGDFLMDPPSPAVTMTRQKRNGGDVSPSELSPGLLDLHSFDTELLPEMLAPNLYDGAGGKGFDASELNFGGNKPMGKAHVVLENSLSKSFPSEKDKLNSATKIKVVVRKRPLNKKEVSKKEEDIISIEHSNSLTVHETKLKVDLTEYVEKHEFVFDAVLDEDVSNDTVYHQTVEQIVPAIFQKVKATCFAYGQTGSGKTYTMQPLPLKASQDILRLMHHAYRNQGFQLFVSFFEIYGGKLYDLLNDRSKLCMREDGKQQVCIVGLQEYRVSNVDSIKELIDRGNATRSTGTTGANEESSRSHAILQLVVKRSVDGSDTKPARIVGKLSFIDLAGSERGADTTDNDKQTRIEGAEINKSLLALKECIRALDNSQVHIPFRGSKLTEVLRDSFIGNSRTVMISCISPNAGSCEHTLNTLRYADRVKSLSKGNGLKRDMSATNINLRESTSISLSSNLHTVSTTENNKKYENTANGSDRFGWTKHVEKEIYPPFNYDLASSGRDVNVASTRTNSYREQSREDVSIASSRSNFYREQSTNSVNIDEDDFDDEYEHGQRFLRNRNGEPYLFSSFDGKGRRAEAQSKSKDANNDAYSCRSEEDFNALLMLEEDLVIAHRKQVEDTIDIVREEMELLDEADQPGNQLDDYISRLNNILSQKAAGIVNLQSRLAHFQRRLTEHNVLSSNMGP